MNFNFEQDFFPDGEELIEREAERNNEKAMVDRIKEEYNDKKWEKEGLDEKLHQEAMQIRDDILEEAGFLTMSKDEFEKHFSFLTIRQGNTGICYNDAAIAAIAMHPNFEMFVRASMERLPNKSWRVSVPFLDKKEISYIVEIEQSDIDPQENPKFGFAGEKREILNPAAGAEGMRVLEALYTKIEHGNDRIRAEGGFSKKVLEKLLGGDNFIHEKIYSLSENDRIGSFNFFFRKYRPESHIATASSQFSEVGDKKESKSYNERKGHAYAIIDIDREKEEITIVNPHNTGKRIVLAWKEFINKFKSVEYSRIDYAGLLLNMKHYGGELPD